jgi:hypothetical protein
VKLVPDATVIAVCVEVVIAAVKVVVTPPFIAGTFANPISKLGA